MTPFHIIAMFPEVLFVVALACAASAASGKSCKLTLQTDLDPKREPLVLVRSGGSQTKQSRELLKIAYPETVVSGRGVLSVKPGDELVFQCPGDRNENIASGRRSAHAVCDGGKLMIGNKKVGKASTSCSSGYSKSSLRVTQDVCGRGQHSGVVVEMGFELEDKSWLPLVEACHNVDQGVTFYSYHTLEGRALKGAVVTSERRAFSRGSKDLFTQVNPDSLFPKKAQEESFTRILGDSTTYISDKSFLSKGHLAPDADFIYFSGQLLTYYYANMAPQWQSFNVGNWRKVETAVRNLAKKMEQTLNVWTGIHGILELPDTKGVKRPVYLEPAKKLFPVPEIFWKLVQDPQSGSCTVAVGHNDVFLEDPPAPVCTARTPEGWPSESLGTLAKGYTYYCDYQSFVKAVSYAPRVDCEGLLEFPQ